MKFIIRNQPIIFEKEDTFHNETKIKEHGCSICQNFNSVEIAYRQLN